MVASMMAAIAPQAWGTGLLHFTVTQVRQLELGTPTVRAYLDLQDLDGQPVQALPESSLAASLGQWNTEVIQVAPFASLDQGVAYVFLVDISKSLSTELFDQMVGGMETWVKGMGPADRAAIIAFGETSRLLTDFTGDEDSLLTALESLGPTDNETLLYQAMADGLDLSGRLDPGLPGRRALVVFSDGKDEGSGIVTEDLLTRLREDPTPIYAIGYSRLRDADERDEYLRLLQRFATNSGGAFYEAEQTRFAEAYDTIRRTIGEVWVADFSCPDCQPDGSRQRLQVKVDLDGQVLSGGGSVRLLPLGAASGSTSRQPAAGPVSIATETSNTAVESGPSAVSATDHKARSWVWLIALGLLALAVLIWKWWTGRERRDQRESDALAKLQVSVPPPAPIDPRSEAIIDPPKPPPLPAGHQLSPLPPTPESTPRTRAKAPPIPVRLIVVRGSRRGKQYSFVVHDRAVVGKRSSCSCVLAEESGIDAEQFELLHEDGGLFIRNLSEHLPTLISGGPINGKLRLASDTLIGTGDTVLRIVFF